MSLSILEVDSELEAMLHGTSLAQIVNIEGVYNRAARQVLLDIDPAETKRIVSLSTPIFYNIFDYNSPEDLKGDKIIDLIPLKKENIRDVVYKTYNQSFDVNKNWSKVNNCTVISDTGNKYLRIDYNNASLTSVIDTASSISSNGTWSVSGTASNLSENTQVTNGTLPTLSFDISTGTGIISNSQLTSVDLSEHYNQAYFFYNLYLPDSTNFTSTYIRVGSSASDYYQSSALTTQFNSFAVKNGYNQFGVKWSDMTTVGTPDNTDIKYVAIYTTVSNSLTGVCLSQIQNSLGVLFDIEYYSKYIFRDSTGVWKEKTTSKSDLINLDTESYNIFLYQAAFLAVQQALGYDAGYDTNVFLNKYNEAISRYKRMYKSEIQKSQTPYYQRTFGGYKGMIGKGYV